MRLARDRYRALLTKRADDAKKSSLKVTPSTGNVFRDLGLSVDEAGHLLVRADLLIQMQKAIASRGLTQVKAAKPAARTASTVGRLTGFVVARARKFRERDAAAG